MKAVIVTTDGVIRRGNLSFADIQRAVGGFVEALPFGSASAYINEDGKGLQLPQNRVATALCIYFGVGLRVGDYISGDMVVVGGADANGNDTDIPTQLAKDIAILGRAMMPADGV